MSEPPIVVFDGVCHLCNGWVDFILRHDRRVGYRFAAMQSARGQALIAAQGYRTDSLPTLLLFEDGRCRTHTDAIIRIVSSFGGAWRLAQAARVAPPLVRDPLYRLIARNRYRMFGRRDSCRVPPAEARDRFL